MGLIPNQADWIERAPLLPLTTQHTRGPKQPDWNQREIDFWTLCGQGEFCSWLVFITEIKPSDPKQCRQRQPAKKNRDTGFSRKTRNRRTAINGVHGDNGSSINLLMARFSCGLNYVSKKYAVTTSLLRLC